MADRVFFDSLSLIREFPPKLSVIYTSSFAIFFVQIFLFENKKRQFI